MNDSMRAQDAPRKVGGFAALYLALAYIAAMPYFLLVVDYTGATTVADKVALVLANYASMYAMYLVTYVILGIVLGVLVISLHDRLQAGGRLLGRVASAVGLLWAFVLVASGMVFNYGMTTLVGLSQSDPTQAGVVWQAIEPVALGLGGAGGEILGGLWVLLVSVAALRSGILPRAHSWLGVVIGVAGIVSVVPVLHEVAYLFGLLQIVWFAWLGVALLRGRGSVATVAYDDGGRGGVAVAGV
jgi:hypothetical protein